MSQAQFDAADTERPATITVVGDELMEAVMRSRCGAFVIHQMRVGKTNAEWVLSVTLPPPGSTAVPMAAECGSDLPY